MRNALRQPQPDTSGILAAVNKWLSEHPDCKNIAIYSALPGEVSLTPLVLEHPQRRWLFPRVEGPDLHFHWVHDPAADLEPGNFGILEPVANLPIIDIPEIDAFFCPGLAFEANGARLGRGAGFYDRMLTASRRDAHKIGVCYPCQIVKDVFPEPHDIPMDLVLY